MAQIPTSTRAHFFVAKLQEIDDISSSLPEINTMLGLLNLGSKLVRPVLQRFLRWDAKNLTFKKLESSIKQNRELLEAICHQTPLPSERLLLGFIQKVIGRNKKALLD